MTATAMTKRFLGAAALGAMAAISKGCSEGPKRQPEISCREAKTRLRLLPGVRRTGMRRSVAQRIAVRSSRLMNAAISFQDSRRSPAISAEGSCPEASRDSTGVPPVPRRDRFSAISRSMSGYVTLRRLHNWPRKEKKDKTQRKERQLQDGVPLSSGRKWPLGRNSL